MCSLKYMYVKKKKKRQDRCRIDGTCNLQCREREKTDIQKNIHTHKKHT